MKVKNTINFLQDFMVLKTSIKTKLKKNRFQPCHFIQSYAKTAWLPNELTDIPTNSKPNSENKESERKKHIKVPTRDRDTNNRVNH